MNSKDIVLITIYGDGWAERALSFWQSFLDGNEPPQENELPQVEEILGRGEVYTGRLFGPIGSKYQLQLVSRERGQ